MDNINMSIEIPLNNTLNKINLQPCIINTEDYIYQLFKMAFPFLVIIIIFILSLQHYKILKKKISLLDYGSYVLINSFSTLFLLLIAVYYNSLFIAILIGINTLFYMIGMIQQYLKNEKEIKKFIGKSNV